MATGVQARMQEGGAERYAGAAARPQAATLYLALFLALLAFFLFLTSISSFDPARAVSVIDSVEARFAEAVERQAGPERLTPQFTGPSGERIVADAGFTAAVSDIFGELVGQRATAADTDGVAWHGVRLDPADVFVRETAALNADARQALEAAASAMATATGAPAGRALTRRIDIAVGGASDLALRRAVALASAITAVNGPQAVSLRTMPADPSGHDSVELVFYAVSPGTAAGAGGR